MRKNLKLTVAGYGALSPREFHVSESLSFPFSAAVVAKAKDPALKLDAMLGGAATFELATARAERSWHGLVAEVEQLQPEPTGETPYLFTIVPAVWLATQVTGQRIFQHLAVPDVVEQLLAPYGVKPERRLFETHPKHEYLVQHGESDFAFASRLLEEAGISYLFEFGAKETKLVLCDQPEALPKRPGPPIHYVPRPNPVADEDYVTAVSLGYRLSLSKVTLADYGFRKPELRLSAHAEAASPAEKGFEQYLYAPDAFLVDEAPGGQKQDDKGTARHLPDEGKRRAERLLTAIRAERRRVELDTNAVDLAPGTVFHVHGHPHPDLGEGAALLVTHFALSGSETGDWTFSLTGQPAADKHKPAHKTQRPLAAGVESAVVVGPKGEEIETDEYGRVRVQFQWDRGGKGVSEGQPSSAWMRVTQPWAGKAWGVVDIPRIGQEVLVRYFEGDPDAPLVAGRVYHKLEPVPYPLPKHQQKTVWKSDSSPHRDNHYNEVRLDDRKDFELFYLQAQRDRQELVRRHETERAGENYAAVIGNCSGAIVAASDAALVGKEYSVQLVDPPTVDQLKILAHDDKGVPPQKKPELEPLPTKIDMVDAKIMATSEQATLEMDGSEIIFEAKGEISLHAKGNVVIEGGPNIKINC